MAAQLKITTVFKGGRTETQVSDWPGWDLKAAASVMRAQHHAVGGRRTYELPLDQRHREAGIVRVTHEWADYDRAASGVAS